jgi:CheY-like chemotaxis protein
VIEKDSKTQIDDQQTQKAIVIVGKSSENTDLIEMLLSSGSTYHVQTYHDPMEVLACLDEIKHAHPILFLIHDDLPAISGMTLCEHLHTLEAFKSVSMIIICASPQGVLEHDAKEKGITVLQKPYSLDVLFSMITQHIT